MSFNDAVPNDGSAERQDSSASNIKEADGRLPVHPLSAIFPEMPDVELRDLAADIAVNGQQQPGTVWKGKLLDGRQRNRACQSKGIKFKYVDREFASEAEALAFVVAANLRRRHLSESQRAMLGARLAGMLAKGAKGKGAAAGAQEMDVPANAAGRQTSSKTRDQAAAAVNVSPRLVQDALKVRADGTPELVAAVNSGEVTVSAAAKVADLPKERQAEVAATPGGVKAAASRMRVDARNGSLPPDIINVIARYPELKRELLAEIKNNAKATSADLENRAAKIVRAKQDDLKNKAGKRPPYYAIVDGVNTGLRSVLEMLRQASQYRLKIGRVEVVLHSERKQRKACGVLSRQLLQRGCEFIHPTDNAVVVISNRRIGSVPLLGVLSHGGQPVIV
jgi:hypothetical protein